jgi:DNA-binding NarL/FixJ family response regulator
MVDPKYEEEIEEVEPESPDQTEKQEPKLLSDREQEILELIWAGYKNKEIGQRLKISVKTVEAHRANMMRKKGVSNVAELLKIAIQDGSQKIRDLNKQGD